MSEWLSKLLGIDRVRLEPGMEWSLDWQRLPPVWVLVLVIIPLIFVLCYAVYRRERQDIGILPKLFLTGLRASLVVLILLLLFGPVLTVETIKVRKSFVIVLVDDSLSMNQKDPPLSRDQKIVLARALGLADSDEITPQNEEILKKLTRMEVVSKVLANPKLRILDEIESKLNVMYFTFSKGVNARPREELREITPTGTETAVGDAIRQAKNLLRGQHVVAFVVISDGKNNSGTDPVEEARKLGQLMIPVFTVSPGIRQEPRDIALQELEARDAVLANDEMRIKFKVRSSGFDNEETEIPLFVYAVKPEEPLNQDPKEIETRIAAAKKESEHSVRLKGGGEPQVEHMVYTPTAPGEYELIIRVRPREGESVVVNNYLTHRLKVVDDKIRVLYAEYPPRYEYRFLKNALVRDQKILCHCLLTSADENFVQEFSPALKEPIREFPRTLKELLEYDVLILGDVSPSELGGEEIQKHIQTFVSEFGGGIILIAGVMNNPRSFKDTPLEPLVPIILEEARDADPERVYDQPYGYRLTDFGKTHPILQFKEFGGAIDRTIEHWEDRDQAGDGMMGILWFAQVRKAKPVAQILLEAALPGEPQRHPLLVTQHYGLGRVFFSATDDTWRWRYLAGDAPWFYPFWQQVMYWVREGKLLGARRYRINSPREGDRFVTNEQIRIMASAYDRNYEPLKAPEIGSEDGEIKFAVEPPQGDRIFLRLTKDRSRDGSYEGSYIPGNIGLYRMWIGEEEEHSRFALRFSVYIPNREEDNPIIDTENLQRMAQESRGRYFSIDHIAELPPAIRKSEQLLTETKEDDLWDSPLVYLVFAFLITLEWIFRKVFRML